MYYLFLSSIQMSFELPLIDKASFLTFSFFKSLSDRWSTGYGFYGRIASISVQRGAQYSGAWTQLWREVVQIQMALQFRRCELTHSILGVNLAAIVAHWILIDSKLYLANWQKDTARDKCEFNSLLILFQINLTINYIFFYRLHGFNSYFGPLLSSYDQIPSDGSL